MPQKKQWKGILIEAIVIVSSILLAFGIDAWWDARKDADRRTAIVLGLQREFGAARTDLERVSWYHQIGRSSAEELMQIGSGGPVTAESSPLVDSLFAGLSLSASFDPPLGTLEALIGSGDLDLLGDRELVVLLTSFPSMVSDLDREQRFLREIMLLLFQHLDSNDMGFGSFMAHYYSSTIPWDVQSDEIYRVVHTAQFRGWVSLMWILYRNTTGDHSQLDDAITKIEMRLAAI